MPILYYSNIAAPVYYGSIAMGFKHMSKLKCFAGMVCPNLWYLFESPPLPSTPDGFFRHGADELETHYYKITTAYEAIILLSYRARKQRKPCLRFCKVTRDAPGLDLLAFSEATTQTKNMRPKLCA